MYSVFLTLALFLRVFWMLLGIFIEYSEEWTTECLEDMNIVAAMFDLEKTPAVCSGKKSFGLPAAGK